MNLINVELRENPVTRANEDEIAQFHRRLSKIIDVSIRRNGIRKQSTIISSTRQKDAFEDSRVTRLYFERYRILELGRMWTIAATIVLMILEYEASFRYQLTDSYNNEIKQLLYLIMLLTILNIIMTFVAYLAELTFQKQSLRVPKDSSIFQTNLIYSLMIEILVQLPCPTPFTMNERVYFQQRYSDNLRFYFVNEILTYIMLYRTLLILNIAFKFLPFYSNRVNRLCRIYSVEFSPHFILKVSMRYQPYSTICGLLILGLFLFSYQLEIAERSLLRTEISIESYSINNSIWVCMITIFTVGYGDFLPFTDLGRLSMALGLVYGVALTSLFTAILYSDLQHSNAENQSLTVLEKANMKLNIRSVSEEIFLNLYKIRNYKQKIDSLPNDLDFRVHKIQYLFSERIMLNRAYRSIDSEDMIAMADRKFTEFKHKFKELQDMLQNMKQQQQPREVETPKIRSNQKQCHTVTAASYEVHSKNDEYFEQLIDSESNGQLMQFEED